MHWIKDLPVARNQQFDPLCSIRAIAGSAIPDLFGVTMRLGLCGTGRMGSAIALRLLESGFSLVAWNRDEGKLPPLVDAGATTAANPATLVGDADVVIVSLLDDEAVRTVYAGDAGLLSGDLQDKTIIETSTVHPATAKHMAGLVAAKGGRFVECPVGGTVQPARDGKLVGLVGGEAAHVGSVRPVLDAMCRRVEHLGPVGSGAAMKLAVNLPLIAYWEALGEALTVADGAGIDLDVAASLMIDSAGAIAVAPMRMASVLQAVNDSDAEQPTNFSAAGMAKDLRLMCELAEEEGLAMPVAEAARHGFDRVVAAGWGPRDGALVAAWPVLARRQQVGKA
jgi:3-hydroxyisobutyrate dehydrogenase